MGCSCNNKRVRLSGFPVPSVLSKISLELSSTGTHPSYGSEVAVARFPISFVRDGYARWAATSLAKVWGEVVGSRMVQSGSGRV